MENSLIMKKNEKRNSNKAGFTLVELLLVVTILGVLASVVVVNLSGTADDSRIQAARQDIAAIEKAVGIYELRTSKFPSSIEDLTQSIGGKPPLINPSQVNDKWGTKYSLKKDDYGVEIRSAGPDMQFNTADDLLNPTCKAAANQTKTGL